MPSTASGRSAEIAVIYGGEEVKNSNPCQRPTAGGAQRFGNGESDRLQAACQTARRRLHEPGPVRQTQWP